MRAMLPALSRPQNSPHSLRSVPVRFRFRSKTSQARYRVPFEEKRRDQERVISVDRSHIEPRRFSTWLYRRNCFG